ncbi:hypothetical protein CHUAL_002787 [Chamberlinius hualienensis]
MGILSKPLNYLYFVAAAYIVRLVVSYINRDLKNVELTESDIESDAEDENFEAKDDSEDGDHTCEPTITKFGLITDLFNGYGLIDREIYFDFEAMTGVEKPRVGLLVQWSVKNNQKLVAQQVEVVWECWDDDQLQPMVPAAAELTEQYMVGKITEITNKICWINGEFYVDLNEAHLGDLTPSVGDWVTVEQNPGFEKSGISNELKFIIDVIRSKQFTGIITKVENDIIEIDSSIYMHRSSCDSDYIVAIGDEVKGLAVESNFEDYEWRATRLIPTKTMAEKVYNKCMIDRVQALSKLVVDKNGITITSPLDFGSVILGKTQTLTANIKNNSDKIVAVPKCNFIDDCHGQLSLAKPSNKSDFKSPIIKPEEEAEIQIICTPNLLGIFKHVLKFDFVDFGISRLVVFHSEDKTQNILLKGLKNHVTPKKKLNKNINGQYDPIPYSSKDFNWVIRGQRVPVQQQMRLPVYIQQHPVPKELWECHKNERNLVSWLPCLQESLNPTNYQRKFSALLHLEEIQQVVEMNKYNMTNVTLKKEDGFLALEIPHLSEGRPSVIVNDRVVLVDRGDISELKYEGYIHFVRSDDILLKFDSDYHNKYDEQQVDINFITSRTVFRRCHQAVHLFSRIGCNILFPTKSNILNKHVKIKFHQNQLFNRSLNERQICAVKGILAARNTPAPYIIYGPPGTGKTVTVIEAILQIFKKRSDSRILVCAPSNSAADLICERLHGSGLLTPAHLVRFNAAHRSLKDLPPVIEPYCKSALPVEIVFRYRIIVSTCVNSALLYQMGIVPGHFTHLFIDEVGQANECEALIPMSLTATSTIVDYQLILAGDPQQLGPVIRSQLSAAYGLQTSLLERICKCNPYLRDEDLPGGYDSNYVTKLIYNYRSHPALITVSNQLFYHSELVAYVDEELSHCLLHWEYLPNKNIPLLFHGIRSQELQEIDSPSWFNPSEIIQVTTYLQSLYHLGIQPEDIGIITPYRRQVERIKYLISDLQVKWPKIGSVEEFQGQERKVIIVSTVRSSDDWLVLDQRNNMGFLSNPKRFNVALTRAQSLLIVVGNPFILIRDLYWRRLISFCLTNEAYVGVDKDELENLIDFMENDKKPIKTYGI